MRFTTAYYLVLLYVTVMLKPLIPIVSDTLSHIFSETEHIATVHAKYGSHHLEKEMASSSSNNQDGKHSNSINTEEQAQVHISPYELLYNFSPDITGKSFPFLNYSKPMGGFILKQFPPPKFR